MVGKRHNYPLKNIKTVPKDGLSDGPSPQPSQNDPFLVFLHKDDGLVRQAVTGAMVHHLVVVPWQIGTFW